MIRTQPLLVCAALASALVAAPAAARAGGTVLSIDGDDIYIDLGSFEGVGYGSQLTLYHVVTARHPVTGQTLRDRFALGELSVVKSGDHVCVARAPDAIKPRVRVGDEVELASAPQARRDPWVERIEQRKTRRATQVRDAARPARATRDEARDRALAMIADAEAAEQAWQRTLGKPPADRIAVWQEFVSANPLSDYARNAQLEIERLRLQIQDDERLTAQLAEPDSHRARLRVRRLSALMGEPLAGALSVRAPDTVYEGAAVPLAFTVLTASAIDRAWLYYRRAGDDSFQRAELAADGDAYLRATIPADVARPPAIEYFVEIAGTPDAAPQASIGSQEAPQRIDVDRKVEDAAPDIDDRSRVSVFTDYVDFDGKLGEGFDQYLHAEIDFMYRFFKPVYAMRVGFGTLGGVGGPAAIIDADPENCTDGAGNVRCRRVTYSYAYAELEFRFSRAVALMLRPQFGTGTSDKQLDGASDRCLAGAIDDDCRLFSAFGMRARVRFGDEQATNLALAVGLTQDVGTVFEAAFAWDVIPRFPIQLSAQVTDQPVPEDCGVRLIADVGWRAVSWVYPSLRLAYQARNVNHAGVSGGVGLNFDW